MGTLTRTQLDQGHAVLAALTQPSPFLQALAEQRKRIAAMPPLLRDAERERLERQMCLPNDEPEDAHG